jgi:hypothetical protein
LRIQAGKTAGSTLCLCSPGEHGILHTHGWICALPLRRDTRVLGGQSRDPAAPFGTAHDRGQSLFGRHGKMWPFAGCTNRVSCSIPVTFTGAPSGTAVAETASQYSPRAKTLPPGQRSPAATPTSPIIPSLPVTTRFCRARMASVVRNVVMRANGSPIETATAASGRRCYLRRGS